jgi:hypothetical protein
MAKITSPVPGFSGEVVGVYFVKGTAEPDAVSESALSYFRRHGYTIDDGEPVDPNPPHPEGDPDESWSVAQLKAYAEAHEIEIKGDARRRDPYLNAIAAAKAATAAPKAADENPPAGE